VGLAKWSGATRPRVEEVEDDREPALAGAFQRTARWFRDFF
jgi:hypothetical protein